MRVIARRVFVAGWIVAGILGALNHTVLGRRLDLRLPHLRYGYVMFSKNLHTVWTYQYARPGQARRDLAELVPTPAPGYQRTRLAMDVLTRPLYLRELCNRALRSLDDEITIYIDEYQVDKDPRRPARTHTSRCDAGPRAPR